MFTRFDEIIHEEETVLLPPSDPRAVHVQAVAERLVQALHDDKHASYATFPREAVLDHLEDKSKRRSAMPSAQALTGSMPFMPEVSGVERPRRRRRVRMSVDVKRFHQGHDPRQRSEGQAWSIWVVDLPKVSLIRPAGDGTEWVAR